MAKVPKKAGRSPKQKGAKQRAGKPKQRQGPEREDVDPGPPVQLDPEQGPRDAPPPPAAEPALLGPGADVLDRLWTVIESRKGADPGLSHAARLLARGPARVAQKLGEEAIECAIEIVAGGHEGLIGESADVLYHLLVAWVSAGVRPEEVWRELQRREQVSHVGEAAGRKRAVVRRVIGRARATAGTTKIP